jgi:cell division protein FtsB
MSAAAVVRTVPRRAGAPAAGRPHLRVVGEPRRGSRYLLAAVLAGGVGLFGVVGLHARAAEQSFQVRNLESEVRELSLRYDELTAEIAGLESPERVRQVATLQLGMVPAREPGFLVADTSRSGDADFVARRGTLRPSAGSPGSDDVADPVKQVLAAGR